MQIFYILILNLPDDEPLSKVRNDRREMLGNQTSSNSPLYTYLLFIREFTSCFPHLMKLMARVLDSCINF